MANLIQTAEKYIREAFDGVITINSTSSILRDGSFISPLEYDKDTPAVIKILKISNGRLGTYKRVNSGNVGINYSHYQGGQADGFPVRGAGAEWETFTIRYDRGAQFQIDRIDNQDTLGVLLGNLPTQISKNAIIPEKDAIVYSEIARNCRVSLGNRSTTALTSGNIITELNKAFAYLTNHGVAETDQIIFLRPEVEMLLKGAPTFVNYVERATKLYTTTGKAIDTKVIEFNGHILVVVPSDRFFTDVVLGEDGYYASATSKLINFLVVSRGSVFPATRLELVRFVGDKEIMQYDGYALNVRILHDAFVMDNKVFSLYANISNESASGASNILGIIADEGSVENAYVVHSYITVPGGVYGKLVSSKTAFAVGAIVNIDGTKITEVPLDTDIVDATNSSLYFALLGVGNQVIMVSGAVALPKKSA